MPTREQWNNNWFNRHTGGALHIPTNGREWTQASLNIAAPPVGALFKLGTSLADWIRQRNAPVGPMPNENANSFYPNNVSGASPFTSPYGYDYTTGRDFALGISPYNGPSSQGPVTAPDFAENQYEDATHGWLQALANSGSHGSSGVYRGAAQSYMGGTYGGGPATLANFVSHAENGRSAAIPGIESRFGAPGIDLSKYEL